MGSWHILETPAVYQEVSCQEGLPGTAAGASRGYHGGGVGCPWHLRLQCTGEVLGRGLDVGQVCRTSFIVHGAAALCQGSLRPERQVLYWFPPHR